MEIDPRTPVIVGVGQVNISEGEAPEPTELLAEAARRAAADAGAVALLAQLDSIRVVHILSRRYPDPATLVAERLGVEVRQTVYTTDGGNTPQLLVDATAEAIGRGELDVALIGGGESWRTRAASRRRGEHPAWTRQADGARPTAVLGSDLSLSSPEDAALGLLLPVQFYPMFDNALHAKRHEGRHEHLRRISELWAGLSRAAATNPHAAIPQAYSAEEIATPGPENRMIGWPYPKRMNSNSSVDQAAALILCSVEAARRHRVATDRWVFLQGAAEANDVIDVFRRQDLAASPAIRAAGAAALGGAGIGIDDIAHVDLYSCFPSAVQVAAAELGLGLGRPLTVTGGLTFAGGPWNNYVTHSIATMVGLLREDPDAFGLCTANGGNLTKHAVGIYSGRPPHRPLQVGHPQDVVDAVPCRARLIDPCGPARIETFTVMHDRQGRPERAFLACLDGDGHRAVGATDDVDDMAELLAEDPIGRPVQLAGATVRLGG